jgi:DNA invertase Pin-like site-specific DNA recombinase
MTTPARPTALRCAIYTRKSSEDGLDQEFNSLHAQRDACEAYVRSQAGEGWRALASPYDDGGISGGTMDRPGLARLLADIEAGKVDVVVVYKVDRLTRSLADFAKMVEVFDRRGVSFVSVTQAFNTTSSMGRLTLNVLLSFAQFEREVTGERIRDKIAASKRKGLWMGGNLPLGYDASGRSLAINEGEAQHVRAIFQRYLEIGSVHRLRDELAAQAVCSKQRTTRSGRVIGGGPMNRGALFHLLSNRVYVGEIPHKGESYPGLHPPIIERDVFDAVQVRLAAQTRRTKTSKAHGASPLTGKLFDATGKAMSPVISYGKSGRAYRYYVSTDVQLGLRLSSETRISRLPGPATDSLILPIVARLAGAQPTAGSERSPVCLRRIDVHSDNLLMELDAACLAPRGAEPEHALRIVEDRLCHGERALTSDDAIIVSIPICLKRRGGRTWAVGAASGGNQQRRPDRTLIAALRKAHALLRAANASPLLPASSLVDAEGIADCYDRKLIRLAFLAPDIQSAILNGRQPASLSLKDLIDAEMPGSWPTQRQKFGFGELPR